MIRQLILFGLTIFSFHTLALGQIGHRITGEIAEKYLTENTKIELRKLVGDESLAEISTYADEMRSSDDEFWKVTARPYHYVTVPKGKTYDQVGAPIQGDAMFALEKCSKIVRDPGASKIDKTSSIKLIVHLIGDLHQPLHVGAGLDRGGNDVKVKFVGKDTNLHSVWDSGMINRQQLSYSEWANWLSKKISAKDVQQWSEIDPRVWIKESAEIRDTIYPKVSEIGYEYEFKHLPILKLRMQQAGVRIAAYLNNLLKNQKAKN